MSKRAKRGFASVWQQRSGRYAVRFTTPDGRRVSAGRTFQYRKTAEAFAADKRREMERQYQPEPERVTFADYAVNWLASRQVSGRPLKPRTVEQYQSILDDHLLPAFGSKLVGAITPADVREWHSSALVNKPTMRSHCYGLLHAILGGAVNEDVIPNNPCHIPGAGNAKRVIKIVPATVEELSIITAAMPERLRLMIPLASWCAMRFGEVIELRRHDIDVAAEVIRVRRAAVKVNGVYQVGDPKSEAGARDISIPPHLIPVIETHLANHVDPQRDALLFPNDTGGHLNQSTLARHFYRARKQAGRDDLRFHDLRHSGAVFTALTGATLAELMGRLGHSTPTAAMRYQHVAQNRDREIAALLSKLAENTSITQR
jgi:integrase